MSLQVRARNTQLLQPFYITAVPFRYKQSRKEHQGATPPRQSRDLSVSPSRALVYRYTPGTPGWKESEQIHRRVKKHFDHSIESCTLSSTTCHAEIEAKASPPALITSLRWLLEPLLSSQIVETVRGSMLVACSVEDYPNAQHNYVRSTQDLRSSKENFCLELVDHIV